VWDNLLVAVMMGDTVAISGGEILVSVLMEIATCVGDAFRYSYDERCGSNMSGRCFSLQ
jgi:hypothetical protein